MRLLNRDLKGSKEKIKQRIDNSRRKFKIRHTQDLIKKQKELSYIKEIKIVNKILFVKLQGSIDSSTIPVIETRYSRGLREGFDGHVILDFKKVEHIDSSTLAILILLFLELKTHNKKLAILSATTALKNYIQILELKPFVKLYDNKKDAMIALA